MSSPSRFIARALVALAALACLAALGRAAEPASARKPSATAAMSGEAPAAMKDALDAVGLPHYVAPEAYSVDMVMNGDGKTFTMKRFIDQAKVRTEISAEGQNLVMIETGDEKGTTYNVMPDRKMAIKQTAGTMESALKAAHQEMPKPKAPAAASAPEGYKVEDLGDETVDGKVLKKLRFTGGEGSALGWFDKATGAPARMESDANGKKSTIEWKNLKAGPQPAELFTVPKEYKVTDMDEMIAKMNSMGGSGMGSMAKGMGQGMMGGMAQNFGQSMGSSIGSKLGASFGGPIGAVAGQYIGGKIGGMLAKKVADKVTGASAGN